MRLRNESLYGVWVKDAYGRSSVATTSRGKLSHHLVLSSGKQAPKNPRLVQAYVRVSRSPDPHHHHHHGHHGGGLFGNIGVAHSHSNGYGLYPGGYGGYPGGYGGYPRGYGGYGGYPDYYDGGYGGAGGEAGSFGFGYDWRR
ncbi:glycine-rich cell wall structural protein-like [Athalia rosae]|uniref:glycine-rich cell wall structural protein-like n=1 Tax=Athalia rosae TaxID=37344 RepID=UPI0020348A9D|nr:glycine-rich cell wall structural protein-like [Athalia rosae]